MEVLNSSSTKEKQPVGFEYIKRAVTSSENELKVYPIGSPTKHQLFFLMAAIFKADRFAGGCHEDEKTEMDDARRSCPD